VEVLDAAADGNVNPPPPPDSREVGVSALPPVALLPLLLLPALNRPSSA
jgi:hypothetical protein